MDFTEVSLVHRPPGEGFANRVLLIELKDGDSIRVRMENNSDLANVLITCQNGLHRQKNPPRKSKAAAAAEERGIIRPEIAEAFKLFDANKDGTMTVQEMVGIMTHPDTGHPMTMTEATAFISRFDKNKDGILNLEEFAAAMG